MDAGAKGVAATELPYVRNEDDGNALKSGEEGGEAIARSHMTKASVSSGSVLAEGPVTWSSREVEMER